MKALLLTLLLLATQSNLLRPAGFVNDFANILPAETEKNLETKLIGYEKQTSIEVAVVTVASLEGLEVEEYSQRLWEVWKIGQQGKDNGILFIIAPNERKVRIQTGYGMEPDLPDLTAGRILDDEVIPFFKNNDMAGGVVGGVEGILKSLGNTPYQTRLEERRKAELERQRQRELAAENFKSFALVVLGIFATLLVVGTPIYFLLRYYKDKKRLQELFLKNQHTVISYKKRLSQAINEYSEAVGELVLLKRESPEEVWKELAKRVDNFDPRGPSLPLRFIAYGWKQAEEVEKELKRISPEVDRNANILKDIKAKREEVKKAKKAVQEMRTDFTLLLKNAQLTTNHSDVSEKNRTKVSSALVSFQEACGVISSSLIVDWIAVKVLFADVEKLLDEAVVGAKAEKEFAQKAREEGPKLFHSLPKEIESAKQAVNDSDVESGTKQKARSAEEKYEEAEKLAKKSGQNWILVYPLLLTAAGLASEAKRKAASDKADAERARRRQREESHSSYSSSSSSSGSFGGFGGGRSGGGGASRRW